MEFKTNSIILALELITTSMKIGKLKSKFESLNLTSIIKSIKFYSRNNIAVRGHPDKNALNSGDI